jgi:hypothetical protein
MALPAAIEAEAAGGQIARGPQRPTEADAHAAASPEPSNAAEPPAEQPNKKISGLTAALAACQSTAAEQPAMASTDATDADVTARGAETPLSEDVVPADTTAAGLPLDAGPEVEATEDLHVVSAAVTADVAGMPTAQTCEATEAPIAAAASAEASPDIAPEPEVEDAPVLAAEAPAGPVATVIRFEPRQRKAKADAIAPKPEAAPRRRRVASRIAAGIVALIAAASALVLADREAIGGPQMLPWVSPLPSYRMPWSAFAPQTRAEGPIETGVSFAGGVVLWHMSP